MVTIERINGEFSARIGTLVLHKGKSAKAIARCYDIKDAMEKRFQRFEPFAVGTTTFPASVDLPGKTKREFFVTVEGIPLCVSTNANRVYEFCDELNRITGHAPRAPLGTVLVQAHEQPGTSEAAAMGSIGLAHGMPEDDGPLAGPEDDFGPEHDIEVLGAQE